MTQQKVNLKQLDERLATEETLENFKELYEKTLSNFVEGSVVKGKLIKINPKEVLVDINYKCEGIVPLDEFPDIDDYKIGDEVEVLLESLDDEEGLLLLSKGKVDKTRRWEQTIAGCAEDAVIEGKIFKKVKGGLMVDIGVEAFLPGSQLDIKPVPNMDDYLGKTFEFKILKINEERKNIVVSRRELLEEQRKKERDRLIDEINEGDVVTGFVKNITDFGAFIDLNGLDGLLHITDMSWGRISHPSELVTIGEQIEVVVLKFDKDNARISLGLKQKSSNPWETVEENFPVGAKVIGRVVNIMPYGAFVELKEGIEGLIHISEFSWTKRINHPSEILNVGDDVEAMVLSIEKEKQKISLGIKQTEFNPWSVVDDKYPAGKRVQGTISNITSYGAFVELEEGIDGLIHISDISWTKKINNPAEVFQKSDTIEAIVLSVDKDNKKIALGIKQLVLDPWEKIEEQYEIGQVVTGTVSKITGFGIFVNLEDDLEGLIHATQLAETPPAKVEDVVNVGDEITAAVVKIDPVDRKIALSVKEYLVEQKRQVENSKQSNARKAVKEFKTQRRRQTFESSNLMSEKLDEALNVFNTPAETAPKEAPVEVKKDVKKKAAESTEEPTAETPDVVAEVDAVTPEDKTEETPKSTEEETSEKKPAVKEAESTEEAEEVDEEKSKVTEE